MSHVRVELYGIPRLRVGAATVCCQGKSLGDVLTDLARRFPHFADDCLANVGSNHWIMNESTTASIDGQRFVRDSATPLDGQDVLLIMSADAGG